MRIAGLGQPVYGADGVDDAFAQQLVGAGDFGVAGFAAAVHFALVGEVVAGGGVDGAADAAAGRERFVRGIDDGAVWKVDFGDVGADEADFGVDGGVGGEEGFSARGEFVCLVEERDGGDVGLVQVGDLRAGHFAGQGLEPGH